MDVVSATATLFEDYLFCSRNLARIVLISLLRAVTLLYPECRWQLMKMIGVSAIFMEIITAPLFPTKLLNPVAMSSVLYSDIRGTIGACAKTTMWVACNDTDEIITYSSPSTF